MGHKPRKTLWKLDDHTRGKHDVLREYLKAWMPIIGKDRDRIVFIDAFAGPGRYEGGEDGSPLIALKALIHHPAKDQVSAEAVFLFIEKRKDRAAHLRAEIAALTMPSRPAIKCAVESGTYQEHVTEVLDRLALAGKTMAPALVMIDPFGISGVPMAMMGRLFAHPKTEVIVSVMMTYINRFLRDKKWEVHLDQLFGCADWREAKDETSSSRRFDLLYNLYRKQLKNAGATYVLRVDLMKGNILKYTLFFATQSLVGCKKMKEGLWRMFNSPDFQYTGPALPDPEENLDLGLVESGELSRLLRQRFGGQWVTIEEVNDFMSGDETLFHPGHLKKDTLRPMERAGLLEVADVPGVKRRQFTYVEGKTTLRLKPI